MLRLISGSQPRFVLEFGFNLVLEETIGLKTESQFFLRLDSSFKPKHKIKLNLQNKLIHYVYSLTYK